MKGIGCSYVLILVYVDNDWMDIAGNVYPSEGYVEADHFTKDIDIQHGLYGILWGKTERLPYEKINEGHWCVVKAELSEDLIRTDSFLNRYKFSRGFVVHSGNLLSAAEYIVENKHDEDFIKDPLTIQSEEIVGTHQWMKEHKLVYS